VEFSTLVKNHSDDSVSAQKGGELGWVSAEVFPNEILSFVDSAGVGAVIPPLLQPEGVAIYRIADIKESHSLKLEEDMDVIREFARQWKFNQKLDRIINNLKENIYVEIKDNRFKPYIK
jgi:parvulin-like peptidyl-prolyl isomerase